MALPKHLQPALTPDELTFLAEHDEIDIVPSFSMSRVRLLSLLVLRDPGVVGVPARALPLARMDKADGVGRLRAFPTTVTGDSTIMDGAEPEAETKVQDSSSRMAASRMQVLIKDEMTNATGFEPLPRRFMETAKVLLDVAPDDLHQPAQLRSLLKDLREVRQAKIRIGLQSEDTIQGGYLNVQGLTPLELTELKPFLVKAMSVMQTLEPKTGADGYGASQD